MEERGKGRVNYLVLAKYIIHGTVWKTYQKEFNNIDAAKSWAEEMYNATKSDRGEECAVMLYELMETMN